MNEQRSSGRAWSSLFFQTPRLTALAMLVIIAAGLSAFLSIGRQEDPPITNLFATIKTVFPGADPARVEALVSEPVERALREVAEIAEIRSTSSTGISIILIELQETLDDAALESAWSEIRDKLGETESGLPRGAPAGGIYWVNDEEPGEPIRQWLEERNTLWTPYSDFEGLMYLLRREFELGHPRIDRFDKILQRYDAQFHALSARGDLKPDTLPGFGAPVSPDAVADAAPVLASRPASVQPPVAPPEDAAEAEAEWSYSLAGTVADGFDRHDVIAEEDMPAHGEDAGFEAETSPALFGVRREPVRRRRERRGRRFRQPHRPPDRRRRRRHGQRPAERRRRPDGRNRHACARA